ncbi:sigma-54-dependent Fis family transcriptional regulator [Thiocapsa imhoffii]|uniref:Sigma-54-dependent Fis family transcriptional regulator n=1 Tax=Thiocapsa imhoffii TaxID=382777 RepID=A0A9X0WGH3_9GAMM|nr:sigma-54 dependent transcriptional regulator [Thiocapsa imhoffii]MBK1644294.1 sigma-54-dependent Fis family transcriptional regulator [Thiocapsa imhoffii]
MTKARALVVDDERDILDLLSMTLGRMDIQVSTADNLTKAKQLVETDRFDLCLTDMSLPDGNGVDLIRFIAAQRPQLPVAMITAHGNMESAVAAMKAGAFDFVAKPVDLKQLRLIVEAALRLRGIAQAAADDDLASAHLTGTGTTLIGASTIMQQIRRLILKLARNQAPVFITGESGTGKELAARMIHAQGPRSAFPFVAVNCGAIPQDLVESELFGHKKGSFTGAVSDKDGLFQAACGGTLFLDEVAELPLATQVKLLRAIQEKTVRPVGAQQETSVNVRIISASHRDLALAVDKGTFRQDLFYRINVIELRMPALREHPEDIPLFAERILARLAPDPDHVPQWRLTTAARQALMDYDFPGNVRELENILERATALCEETAIGVEDLYLPVTAPPATSPPDDDPQETVPLEDYLGEIERKVILDALEKTHWNRTAAAKQLGMTLRSLRYRLAKLGIE